MEELMFAGMQMETGNMSPEGLFGSISSSGEMMVVFWIGIVLGIFQLITQAMVLNKAKLPRWGLFIPFYNIYLLFKLAGRPGGWTRWILFPPVLGILLIIAQFDTAKRFGKSSAFGFWLRLLPIVFYPILAFSKSAIYTPKTA